MNSRGFVPTKILLTFLLLSLSGFFFSCGGNEEETSKAGGGTPVHITHPVLMDLNDYLTLNGNTVFLKKEIIRATFDGFIEKAFKNIGDGVKPGDVLFQLKTKELAASDSINVNLGRQQFKGTVDCKAGSTGTLTELDFHEGDYVTAGEQIAIVSNPSSMRIRLNVPYEDVLKVKTGNACEVQLPDGISLPGIIEINVPSVDQATQTQTFFIALRRFEKIPENLNVIVKIPFESAKNTLVLPKSAIMTNVTQNSFWVMKLINDSIAVRTDIEKGIENDSIVQILSPNLGTADRIISAGAYGLPDTAGVEIVE